MTGTDAIPLVELRRALATWVPGWVAHYYPNEAALARAHRNTKMVTAANAAVRLGSLHELIQKGIVRCPVR